MQAFPSLTLLFRADAYDCEHVYAACNTFGLEFRTFRGASHTGALLHPFDIDSNALPCAGYSFERDIRPQLPANFFFFRIGLVVGGSGAGLLPPSRVDLIV